MILDAPIAVNDVFGRLIEELASRISKRWQDQQFSDQAFPLIAADELAHSQVVQGFQIEQFMDWVLGSPNLTMQNFRKFGEPPLNLYVGSRFFIECLVWPQGETSIHEHAFPGAFSVVHGKSIHTTYEFEPLPNQPAHFCFGSARLTNAEILMPGSTRQIHLGAALTHALYHVEAPTLSIVARTRGRRQTPQHVLLFPNVLALADLEEPEETLVTLMATLSRLNQATYERNLERMLTTLSKYAAFKVLYAGLKHCPDVVHRTRSCAEGHLRDIFDNLVPIAERHVRIDELAKIVHDTDDPEVRYFLALVLNVPSLSHLLRLVEEWRPQMDPRQTAGQVIEKFVSSGSHIDFDGHLARFVADTLGGPTYRPDPSVFAKASKAWDLLCSRMFMGALLEAPQ